MGARTTMEDCPQKGTKLDIEPYRCEECGELAKMQCPKCKEATEKTGCEPVGWFCTQECFKKAWGAHRKAKHPKKEKPAAAKKELAPPPWIKTFNFTGSLRPGCVTEQRTVPPSVVKPDYWATGQPVSEDSWRSNNKIVQWDPEKIETLRRTAKIARQCLDHGARLIRPGNTPEQVDLAVHEFAVANNAYPSALNYRGFPKACCTSVNEVICHGIPDTRPFEDGDLVKLDVTLYREGMHADLCETHFCGEVDEASKKLTKAAYECLMLSIEAVKPGMMFRDLGKIIEKHAKANRVSVVKRYCGHGVGELFHTAPSIPHYAKNKAVGVMKPGMVFTIEPMINLGTWQDETWPDDWTAVTADGKRSAQFEHTMVVTEDGVEVLTARLEDSPAFDRPYEVAKPKEESKEEPKEEPKEEASA